MTVMWFFSTLMHVSFSILILPVLPAWHGNTLSVLFRRDEAAKEYFLNCADDSI